MQPFICVLAILFRLFFATYGLLGGDAGGSGASSPFNVTLQVPRWVLRGGSAVFQCKHTVPPDRLHKVEWLKAGQKIFQYVRERTPAYIHYSVQGAILDIEGSNSEQIMLKDVQFEAGGLYSCEVTSLSPIYTKSSAYHDVTVIQKQTSPPDIVASKSTYYVGEPIVANCTTSPSSPVAHVTWLFNGKPVPEKHLRWFNNGIEFDSTTVRLTVEQLDPQHVGRVELTCIATIPAFLGEHTREQDYADHREHTITVEVVEPEENPEPTTSDGVNLPRGGGTTFIISVSLLLISLFH